MLNPKSNEIDWTKISTVAGAIAAVAGAVTAIATAVPAVKSCIDTMKRKEDGGEDQA